MYQWRLGNLRREVEQVDGGDANALRHLLWKGEDYLEREHREWLWLMLETEWYLKVCWPNNNSAMVPSGLMT